jgi:hypothetical protein
MIITVHYSQLEKRCNERGWSLEEVIDCVVSKQNELWTIDTDHPKYPMYHKSGRVGTELKKILSHIGIKSSPTCSCNKRALLMDQMGIDWCEKNTETICEWLHEEAKNRKIPFIKSITLIIIKRAINNAKKANSTTV